MNAPHFSRKGIRSLLVGCLVGALVLPGLALANTPMPPATTLQEATQRAILNNPEVQARWHTFLAAVDERDVYSSGYRPSIDVQSRIGRQYDHDPRPREDYHFNTTTLQLSQMLYDGFFTRNMVRQFEHAKLVRYYELIDSAQSVAYQAVRAYEDVQRQRELVELARDNYRQHREVFEQIERRVRAGVSRMVDLEQIGGRLALAESNLIVEVSNLHDVSARYQRIVGELPADNLAATSLLDEGVPANVSDALYQAFETHPAFHAAIENITSAQYQKARDRADYHPQVHLRLRNSWNDNLDNIDGRRQSAVIELALNYNLYAGGRTSALSRKNTNLVYEAHDQRDIVCRNIRQEVSIGWSDTQRLAERIRQMEAHRNATDRVRIAYRQQFDIGERNLLDLLDIENEYFEASRSVANAYRDWSIAYARTQTGMGNLLHALGIAREGLPTLSDLGADPVEIHPEWICPAESPEFINMAALTQVPVSAPAPMPTAQAEVITLDAVTLFGFDQHELRPEAGQVLDGLVQRIRSSADVSRIEVVGHTDGVGSETYNQALSERRAQSVRQYMVNGGIPAELITARGMGMSMPVASNATREGRQLNRRVEIHIEIAE